MIKLVDDRIRELANRWPMRPGQVDFDIGYALSIADASDRVALEALVNANPGQPVTLPMQNMGFVPNKE